MPSEDNKDVQSNDVSQNEDKTVDSNQQDTKVDVKQFESMKEELERLKSFHNTILEEKKLEEQKRKDAQAKAAKEVAEKEGNFKELLEITKREFQEKLQEANDRISKYEQEKKDNLLTSEARKIAQQLASKDARRAELLTKEVKSRLKLTEDGVKVVDSKGNLTTDNLESLTLQVKKEFDFLCDAVDSSGSGAKNTITSSTVKSLKDMSESEQRELYRANPTKWRELKQQSK